MWDRAHDPCSVNYARPLLSRSRLRWNQSRNAVVHNQLTVVFSAMLDKGVGERLQRKSVATLCVGHHLQHACVALFFDDRGAIGKRFLDVGNDGGFRLVVFTRLVVLGFLSIGDIGEEVIGACHV